MPKTGTFRIWDEEKGYHAWTDAEVPSAEQGADGRWLVSGSGWTMEFKGEITPELSKLLCETAAEALRGTALKVLPKGEVA